MRCKLGSPLLFKFYLDLREYAEIIKHLRVIWSIRGEIAELDVLDVASLPKKKKDISGKIIWQYWGQGWNDDLPDIVDICKRSIDLYQEDCLVIRLSDATLEEYIDLPRCILELRNYNKAFFSDVLRLALLLTYGGAWLDATVLLTDSIPSEYWDADFFAFQRDPKESNKDIWRASFYAYYGWKKGFRVRMLNAILFAKEKNELIIRMYLLLTHFWKKNNKELHYFMFQIYFDELIKQKEVVNFPIMSDCRVHIVQNIITGGQYKSLSLSDALKMSPIHKLTYKNVLDEKLEELKSLYIMRE